MGCQVNMFQYLNFVIQKISAKSLANFALGQHPVVLSPGSIQATLLAELRLWLWVLEINPRLLCAREETHLLYYCSAFIICYQLFISDKNVEQISMTA